MPLPPLPPSTADAPGPVGQISDPRWLKRAGQADDIPGEARREDVVYAERAWSPGQRALLQFLQREGLVTAAPAPPDAGEVPSDDALFGALGAAVDEAAVARLLAERLHLPLVTDPSAAAPDAATRLEAAVAVRAGMAPLGGGDGTLDVLTANPLDLDAFKTVEFRTGCRVRMRVATRTGVRRALAHLYGADALGDESSDGAAGPPADVRPPAAATAPTAPPPDTAALDALRGEVARLASTLADVAQAARAARTETAAHADELAALTIAVGQLETALAGVRDTAAAPAARDADTALAALRDEVAALHAGREQLRAETVLRAQETESRVAARLTPLAARVTTVAEEVARLRQEGAARAEALEAAAGDVTRVAGSVGALEGELTALRHEVGGALADARTAGDHAREALAAAGRTGERLDALTAGDADTRARVDALARRLDDLDGRLAPLAAVVRDVAALRGALDGAVARLGTLERALARGTLEALVARVRVQVDGVLRAGTILCAGLVRLALGRAG
jgi:predicted  nucleic acid-binding Zn-ribbon protein